MSRKSILPVALAAALMAASACSKDSKSTTGPSNTASLSVTEATSLSNALEAIGLLSFSADQLSPVLNAARTSPGLAAQTSQTINLNSSHQCPAGGTYTLTGSYSYNVSGSNSTFSGNITETPSGCKGSGGDGVTWTVNGNPSLTLAINETINSSTSAITATFHETGALSFASTSNKSGSCSVDINITYNYSAAQVLTGSYSGTVCGQSIGSQTF